jgi:hypothetical protein
LEESTAANNQPGGALSKSGRRNQWVERALQNAIAKSLVEQGANT